MKLLPYFALTFSSEKVSDVKERRSFSSENLWYTSLQKKKKKNLNGCNHPSLFNRTLILSTFKKKYAGAFSNQFAFTSSLHTLISDNKRNSVTAAELCGPQLGHIYHLL